MDIERAAAVISWPVSTTNYIVLSSATPTNGPWYPCLDPIARGPGLCQVAVRTTDHSQYFRLAQGEWVMDDFDDGTLEGWTVYYADPQATNYLTSGATNGQLRIHGTWPGADLSRHVLFYRTNLTIADFALSLDILGWDESANDDIPNIVLLARLDPSFVSPTNSYFYGGGVGMRLSAGDPEQSALWLTETTGPGWHFLGDLQAIGKTDPAKDYRLQFYGVGSDLTVKLFNLTDGTLAAECQSTDDTLTNGWVGFYVVEHGPSGTVDFTLDNFIAVGTTP